MLPGKVALFGEIVAMDPSAIGPGGRKIEGLLGLARFQASVPSEFRDRRLSPFRLADEGPYGFD